MTPRHLFPAALLALLLAAALGTAIPVDASEPADEVAAQGARVAVLQEALLALEDPADHPALAVALRDAEAALMDLQARLSAERSAGLLKARAVEFLMAAANPLPKGAGPLRSCPVGHPHRFTDTFGQARSGGRTHKGIDMLAPLGTPVYAAQAGHLVQDSSVLGGITGVIVGPGGDETYYVHLSRFAGVRHGGWARAGAIIGFVGDTGNAPQGVYHLHFEYHPRGGAAVNPFDLLQAACGSP